MRDDGLWAFFDGLRPMILRRSLDWGIRFQASATMKRYLLARKREILQKEAENKISVDDLYALQLSFYETIFCGIFGGAVSTLTHPLDNIITNCQKPLPEGTDRSFLAVVKRLHKENGYHAFVNGFLLKVFENAHHTAWMCGVGNVLHDKVSKRKSK